MSRDIPASARRAVAARSHGMCELCGVRRAHEVHHRDPRGMGGTRRAGVHAVTNLLHLDRVCHDWAESRSTLADVAGVRLVHRGDAVDPARVPVWMSTVNGAAWWLLRDTPHDGGAHQTVWVDPADYALPAVPDLSGLRLAS